MSQENGPKRDKILADIRRIYKKELDATLQSTMQAFSSQIKHAHQQKLEDFGESYKRSHIT